MGNTPHNYPFEAKRRKVMYTDQSFFLLTPTSDGLNGLYRGFQVACQNESVESLTLTNH